MQEFHGGREEKGLEKSKREATSSLELASRRQHSTALTGEGFREGHVLRGDVGFC